MRKKMASASLALAATLALFAQGRAEADGGEAGIDFRYGNININNPLLAFLVGDDDISLIAIDLHARAEVSPGLSIGGRLPLAHARFDDDSQSTLGNLTLEMRYRLRSELHTRSWIDTSISLPTADDDGQGAQVATAFALFWIPDPGLYLPNTTTFRLMYQHQWNVRRNSHASRGLGIDMGAGIHFLSIDGAEDRLRVPLQVTGKLGLSAQAEAIGRFSTYWLTSAEDGEDDFLHIFEAGLRLAGVGDGSLEILVYLPLDDVYRDTLEAWGISLNFSSGF